MSKKNTSNKKVAVSSPNHAPREPQIGKPIKLIGHVSRLCPSCETKLTRGINFEINGVICCSRRCAAQAAT